MATEKQYLFIEPDNTQDSGMNFFLVPQRWKYFPNDNCINVAEIDVNYTIPADLTEEVLRGMAIATLEAKQKRVIAEAIKRKAELQQRIDQMKRLPYFSTIHNEEPIDDIPF